MSNILEENSREQNKEFRSGKKKRIPVKRRTKAKTTWDR